MMRFIITDPRLLLMIPLAGYSEVGLRRDSSSAGRYFIEQRFQWVFVVLDAEAERAFPYDLDLLDDVSAARGEDKAGAHQSPSSSDSWLRLVADLRISWSILPRSASVSC